MLRPRKSGDNADVKLTRASMPQLLPLLIGVGFLVGALSGFFGIGGGFLIVPGLIGATAMPMLNAIGSSLVSITAFGLTTAASYAVSGLIDWPLAILFIVGGALGGLFGIRLARHLAGTQARADPHLFRRRHRRRHLCHRPLADGRVTGDRRPAIR